MLRFSSGGLMVAAVLSTVFFCGCPPAGNGPVPPEAAFDAVPVAGHPPLEVAFTDESAPGDSPIRAREWDFGDGVTSTDRNPTHIYYLPGSYTVSLTVNTGVGTSRKVIAGFVVVTEATTVAGIGPAGGNVAAEGASLTVPPQAFADMVVVGIAPLEGSVPVSADEDEIVVSDVFTILTDHDTLRVDPRTPLTLVIPFLTDLVPAAMQTPATLQILARLQSGITVPIPGEIENGALVAQIAGLPPGAAYVVVFRPHAALQNVAVNPLPMKAPTSFHWATNDWRVSYSPVALQDLTALRIGNLGNTPPFDVRDWPQRETDATLAELAAAVANTHANARDAGFISPSLSVSQENAFTLVLYHLNEFPILDYESLEDLVFTTSVFGNVVVDPNQLVAISKHNAALAADQAEKMDFSNAFAQEFFHGIFRGYDLPTFSQVTTLDVDARGFPRSVPFYQGFEDGLATYLGQVAADVRMLRPAAPGVPQSVYMARSLGANEALSLGHALFSPWSPQVPAYSFATQDFFFYVVNRFLPADPLSFIADSYEGVLELIRARTELPLANGYLSAFAEARVATDIALQRFFGEGLSQMYHEFAVDRAYHNPNDAMLRPSDLSRTPNTFNDDRFDLTSLFQFTFTALNEVITVSPEFEPAAANTPPLTTLAVLLSAGNIYGELQVSVNAYDWIPDESGNSVRVDVFKDGESQAVELTATNSQVSLAGFGEPASAGGFERAIVLLSNVTLDREYNIILTATVKPATPEKQMGALGGLVTATNTRAGLEGVSVTVRQEKGEPSGGLVGATSTNAQGVYQVPSLPAGDIEVSFSKSGYVDYSVSAPAAAQQVTVVNGVLRPKS